MYVTQFLLKSLMFTKRLQPFFQYDEQTKEKRILN